MTGGSAVKEFLDPERIKIMEEIIRHYTGFTTFDKLTLGSIARSIQSQSADSVGQQLREVSSDPADSLGDDEEFTINPVSPTTAGKPEIQPFFPQFGFLFLISTVYTGEFSHCQFSSHVQRRINEGLENSSSEVRQQKSLCLTFTDDVFPQVIQGVPVNTELNRALRLQSRPPVVLDAGAVFPPSEVANFLIAVFFEYAQTNYFYVDEQSLRQKLDDFFSQSQLLGPSDAAWICTLLMIFAIATQFAHLSSPEGQNDPSKAANVDFENSSSPDDDAALIFYQAAIILIPDVIALASIESVQAFLLLGVYTLPIDAAGLSFTYFGIGIKMAIQNGMHRKYHKGMDARTIELRNRIWWTTYTLEKYVVRALM